jgi:cytoskeleton protein RodZ
MGDLGGDLRRARERAGLSLEHLSALTKIRQGLLDALEHDDFGRLPSGLLTRGHLRAYAREVGLDPESVVHRYRDEFERSSLPSARSVELTDDEIHRIARRIQSGIGVIILAALAAFLFYQDRVKHPSDTTDALNVASTGAIEGSSMASPSVPADRALGDANRLIVRIDPTAVVWVQATADGRRVLYSLIHPDQPRVIEAREELVLLVGDAGAFRYSIDGVPGRPLGASRQVREVRITRNNRTEFQAPAEQARAELQAP